MLYSFRRWSAKRPRSSRSTRLPQCYAPDSTPKQAAARTNCRPARWWEDIPIWFQRDASTRSAPAQGQRKPTDLAASPRERYLPGLYRHLPNLRAYPCNSCFEDRCITLTHNGDDGKSFVPADTWKSISSIYRRDANCTPWRSTVRSARARSNACDQLGQIAAGYFQVIVHLQVQPHLRGRAEIARKAQRSVGGNPTTTGDDVRDAGWSDIDCRSQSPRRHAQGREKFLGQDFTRMDRRKHVCSALRVRDFHLYGYRFGYTPVSYTDTRYTPRKTVANAVTTTTKKNHGGRYKVRTRDPCHVKDEMRRCAATTVPEDPSFPASSPQVAGQEVGKAEALSQLSNRQRSR